MGHEGEAAEKRSKEGHNGGDELKRAVARKILIGKGEENNQQARQMQAGRGAVFEGCMHQCPRHLATIRRILQGNSCC